MKNMRIPLCIALGVAMIGIVFGSLFDFEISKAIASPTNALGLTISAIGPTIGFAGVAVMGGGFISFIVKGKYHIVLKILFGVLAACCLGVSIFYPGGEYFGINGFYNKDLKWLGYVIVIIPEVAAMIGGYFLFKNCKNENMWMIFCIIIVLLLIALLAVIPTIKDNMHRPRYRGLLIYDDIRFHKWWEPFKEYKDLYAQKKADPTITKEQLKVFKENCKSYPSGHTAEASILLLPITFFPLADNRFKKYQMPFFYGACGLIVLVALARILAAAHYLSDVSWGATIMIVLLVITNEIVMRVKALQPKEEVKENE